MENVNVIGKKDWILFFGLACIFLMVQSFSVVFAGSPSFPDDFKVSDYFSFFGSGGIDWRALNDPNNNPILIACLQGSANESLKLPGILDVNQRLERLERGNLIKKVDGLYTLAFPAIVGDKREQLREYAEQTARQLVPLSEKMIAQIRPQLAGRDEMLYHVLWSVVMDGGPAWDAARAEMDKKIAAGDTSIRNKAWLLYPSHPFRAGTNSWSKSFGLLKVTWSRNTPSPNDIGRIIVQYAAQLTQAIEQDRSVEPADAKDALSKYGLVDEAGNVRFYVTQIDSGATQSYSELGTQFGRQMMTYLDVKKVAEMLEVSPGIAFVIAYHEICWQLLQDLTGKKVLSVPPIVAQAGTNASEAFQLVSLMKVETVKDLLPDTEMSAEERKAIEEFRHIKARIQAGESYQDDSTPLHGALTQFSKWEPEGRGYFMGLDILRAPLPPAKPEEGSLWPVYAGHKELEDTFILVYVKGRWIWIGNMGSNVDWNMAKPAFEKWAKKKIDEIAKADSSAKKGTTEPSKSEKSKGNRVLSLDGQADYVRIADSESLHSFSNAITIEVWVKASSYAGYGDINSIIRKNVKAGAENFLLRFRNVDGSLCVQMSLGAIGILRAQHEFAMGNWYHLAGTYDGNAITVLVNGVTIESGNFSGPLYIDMSDLFIGRGDPEFISGEYFHGELDEIRIWNVARKPEEIRAAMNSPMTGKEDGLVVYLSFDDGTAKDLSGHGNDGLLNEDAEIVEAPFPASLPPGQKKPGRLIAWWKLDEADGNDVADSSGNDYAGTLIGNPQWQPTGGKINGALAFDGLGDFVEIGNEPAFDLTGAISIAAWIKVNSFDWRWQAIVTKGDTAWRIQRTAEEDTLAFHCTGIKSITDKWPQGIEGNKSVNDGQWHHVVGVYNGSAVSLYIDGVLDNSSPASGSIQTNDFAVNIGGNSERIDREWNGLIDDVCIIDGAIDDNAVHELYSGADPIMIAQTAITFAPAKAAPSYDKLIAWWKFEDDVNDSAGNNHGTANGNPTYDEGKFGRAISLDGDDYVDCGNPDSLNFGTENWTISAWIKTTQSGTNQDDASMNRGTVFANGGDEAGGIRYAIAVNEGQLGSITLTTDDDSHKAQAIGRTAVTDGAWHHVVGIRKAEQLHIYVDGVLDGGDYLSVGYNLSGTSQHNAYIGVITDNRDGSLYKYFVGLIDELCIIRGAIDADGVRALYSGEDPPKVAQTAIDESQDQARALTAAGPRGSIIGDWRMVSDQISQQAIIEIRKKPDGILTGAIVAENPDETTRAILLDEVTFENGKLRFEMKSEEGSFEGTMKEDGLTIEGEFRQQDQAMAIVLKRVDPIPTETVTTSQEQIQAQTSSTSNIAAALILVLVLAGVVGAIVFFLFKSSIR